ncbi:MAG TPA: glycogen debranching N-terminal domain-containing protein, partial [Candidatus Limnocylindrales bacterium]
MTVGSTPRRATPADPMPGTSVDRSIPSPKRRNLPPELGPDAIAILEGRTFLYSDAVGDVARGSIGGLVHADTRFLNHWLLTVDGERLLALRSGTVDHYSAAFFLTNPRMASLAPNTIGVRRLRFVGDGLHERIEVSSFSEQPIRVELRLAVGNDFADLFEVKDFVRDRSAEIRHDHASDGSRLAFRYANQGFEAETVVEVSPPANHVEGDDLVWDLDLPPRGEWACDLHVPLRLGPMAIEPLHQDFGDVFAPEGSDSVSHWLAQIPHLEADSHLLSEVVAKTARDLLALRIAARTETEDILLPAAGLPWFLTLFGRDTLITAYQTVAFGPRVARGALVALARFQGTKRDDFRDEEPGKILHELRTGELTQLGLKPHSP